MQKVSRLEVCRYHPFTATSFLLIGLLTKSVFEVPPSVLAVKKSGEVEPVACREVRNTVRSTCYRDITTKEPYACSQEACARGRASTADARATDLIRYEAARCPRTRLERQCKTVAGTCYRRERQLREYPCLGREICKVVPTEVARTCVRRSTRQEAYSCEQQKIDRICTEVQVPIEEVCHREESHTVEYPCKKPEFQRVCRPVEADVRSAELCFRTVSHTEEYACTKTETRKTCSQHPVEVKSLCTRTVPRRTPVGCTLGRKVRRNCKNGITHKTSICSRVVRVKQAYDCGEVQSGTECAVEPTCKDKKCKIRRPHPAACDRAPVDRSRICYKDVDEVQEYPCGTPGSENDCEYVEEKTANTCTGTENVEESYACTKVEYEERCEEVPVEVRSTCQKEVPVQEAFPCPAEKTTKVVCEHQPAEVESTCQKQVTVQVPYSCTRTEPRTECRNARVTYPGTCYKVVPTNEEYPCSRIERKQQCTREQKMCSEKTSVEVPYECSRNVCEHVQVPADGVGTKRANGRTSLSCNVSRQREQCSVQEASKPRTCFRDAVAQQAFPCYKTHVTTICRERPPSGLSVET